MTKLATLQPLQFYVKSTPLNHFSFLILGQQLEKPVKNCQLQSRKLSIEKIQRAQIFRHFFFKNFETHIG